MLQPNYLTKVNITTRIVLLSPHLSTGHFSQLTTQLLRSVLS